ncbi:FCD domain-containing protein [Thalassospira australica]|uniref:FCD domain-containing protein n=1 Tax=Thalassospira australica TaxID=1528106 RepID=UPI00051A320D|nr:FCD domain-containing protein [Thalassospira australica]
MNGSLENDTQGAFENEGLRAADLQGAARIASKIEHEIAEGRIENGEMLPSQRELMQKHNAGRLAVSRALKLLEYRGLIATKARCRPTVQRPTYGTALSAVEGVVHRLLGQSDGVRNLYECRLFVEVGLARNAARNARKEDIAKLRAALGANKAAINDSDAFYATDIAFHGLLYEIAKNPIFPPMHKAYTSWLAPYWGKMFRSIDRNKVNFLSHKAIFQAIEDRDADAAEDALRRHLDAAWEYVRVTF